MSQCSLPGYNPRGASLEPSILVMRLPLGFLRIVYTGVFSRMATIARSLAAHDDHRSDVTVMCS